MGKRVLIFLALAVLPVLAFGGETPSLSCAQAPQDSTALAALDVKVEEYLAALETQPTEVKFTETDFIIASCTDSAVLTHVANKVYRHYVASKLMGDDAVAIHIFDTWFADKAVKMGSDEEYFAASFFAAVNRSSLIGRQAPQLKFLNPENEEVTIFGEKPSAPRRDSPADETAYDVLFFYDVGCPTCRAEIASLKNVYRKHSGKLNFYAVYIGTDEGKWREYQDEKFGVDGIVHLWDPEMTADLAFSYGVVGTPRLFLISPDGVILGRSLDSAALESLLEMTFGEEVLEYGLQESMDMYERTFEGSEPCANVSEVAGYIEEMLLPRGDTLLFKQMTGDLLYFLTNRKEARFKCGSEAFIDRYILNRPEIWTTADDSLRVVELGAFVKQLLNLCPVGEKLPAIEVPVEVLSRKGKKITATGSDGNDGIKSKTTTLRLDRQKNCAIMFYSDGCGLCAEDLRLAREILRNKSAVPRTDMTPSKIILIDMDEIWLDGGDLPERLFLNFDLSSLPFIICIDGQGRTAYKYADFK